MTRAETIRELEAIVRIEQRMKTGGVESFLDLSATGHLVIRVPGYGTYGLQPDADTGTSGPPAEYVEACREYGPNVF